MTQMGNLFFVVFYHQILSQKKKLFDSLSSVPPPGGVKFIDYEYADYNYQAFDIGNHFNEFAGRTSHVNKPVTLFWSCFIFLSLQKQVEFIYFSTGMK